eukprot:768331-Hanusia_phi.AAC.4
MKGRMGKGESEAKRWRRCKKEDGMRRREWKRRTKVSGGNLLFVHVGDVQRDEEIDKDKRIQRDIERIKHRVGHALKWKICNLNRSEDEVQDSTGLLYAPPAQDGGGQRIENGSLLPDEHSFMPEQIRILVPQHSVYLRPGDGVGLVTVDREDLP